MKLSMWEKMEELRDEPGRTYGREYSPQSVRVSKLFGVGLVLMKLLLPRLHPHPQPVLCRCQRAQPLLVDGAARVVVFGTGKRGFGLRSRLHDQS